jgi:hypothetical protein
MDDPGSIPFEQNFSGGDISLLKAREGDATLAIVAEFRLRELCGCVGNVSLTEYPGT